MFYWIIVLNIAYDGFFYLFAYFSSSKALISCMLEFLFQASFITSFSLTSQSLFSFHSPDFFPTFPQFASLHFSQNLFSFVFGISEIVCFLIFLCEGLPYHCPKNTLKQGKCTRRQSDAKKQKTFKRHTYSRNLCPKYDMNTLLTPL